MARDVTSLDTKGNVSMVECRKRDEIRCGAVTTALLNIPEKCTFMISVIRKIIVVVIMTIGSRQDDDESIDDLDQQNR